MLTIYLFPKAYRHRFLAWVSFLAVIILELLSVRNASAETATLAWTPSTGAVAGYKLHFGHSSGSYSEIIDVGNPPPGEGNEIIYTVQGLLQGLTYFFAATAYDSSGNESDFSNEVVYTVPIPNRQPVANDQAFSSPEDNPVTGELTAEDQDGDVLTYTILTLPLNGSVVLLSETTGLFSYTPNEDFNGTDSFTFKVNDGRVDSNTATVILTVTPTNDAPVARDDTATTDQGKDVTINVLANDSDVDGDSLIITSLGSPSHGRASFLNEYVTYHPDPGFSGTDYFYYSISDGEGKSAVASVIVTVVPSNTDEAVSNDDVPATPDHTPIICSIDGPEGGPVMCLDRPGERLIVIRAVGMKETLNPEYDPSAPGSLPTKWMDYGFGWKAGEVTLSGLPLTVERWSDNEITARVQEGLNSSGRIVVTRGDNQRSTEVGVTLNFVNCASTGVWRVPGDFATIQDAIDSADVFPGDLVLVSPGVYNENVVLHKPVRIQGGGAGCTTIDASAEEAARVDSWRHKIAEIGAEDLPVFSENEAPGITIIGIGSLNLEGKSINFGTHDFSEGISASVDGVRIMNSATGGGIFIPASAHHTTITNCEIAYNRGIYGGGIVLGVPYSELGFSSSAVTIAQNKIHRNEGSGGGGGIAIYSGSYGYLVADNSIQGNIAKGNGGGIAHLGLSDNGIIRGNQILSNESMDETQAATEGNGSGIYISGGPAGRGSGNLQIEKNLIQANLARSGSGAGIYVSSTNGQEVLNNPHSQERWYRVTIRNNMIVNNIAGFMAGAIYLKDTYATTIVHNTIANNESISLNPATYADGSPVSTPSCAGVVADINSSSFNALHTVISMKGFPDPILLNNIIRHNRSWGYNLALNAGKGAITANAAASYWDLHVVGSLSAADYHLSPMGCILSDTKDPVTDFQYAMTNHSYDPYFQHEYFNQTESGRSIDWETASLWIRLNPIAPYGDYHISPNSAAVDMGLSDPSVPAEDKDGDPRNSNSPDIGADERPDAKGSIMEVIEGYYTSILGRSAERTGAEWWLTEIKRIDGIGIDIKEGFLALAQLFFRSNEYTLAGWSDYQYVTHLYNSLMDRTPADSEVTYWVGAIKNGLSRENIFCNFAYSEEFRLKMTGLFGSDRSLPENNLINDMYRGLLSRLPDDEGFNYWRGRMQAAMRVNAQAVRQVSAEIAHQFISSYEYSARKRTNAEFIDDMYNAVLRRGADSDGWNFWYSMLENNTMTRTQILDAFIMSPEFQGRVSYAIASAGLLSE